MKPTHDQSLSGIRRSFHLVMTLAVLAWVLQMALAQWSFGEEPTTEPASTTSTEKFVTGRPRFLAAATLELRGEATITGGEVKLKQICRWADADKSAFEPVADLIVLRMGATSAFRSLSLKELETLLQDAGVNLALIRFAGTTSCTIGRNDVAMDEHTGLQEWVDARLGKNPPKIAEPKPEPVISQTPTGTAQTAAAVQGVRVKEPVENHALRTLLIADLAERLLLDPTSIQMKFSPADEKVLALCEPQFQFNIDSERARSLGAVTWDVTIMADTTKQKVTIGATARAWQDQLVVIKPMAYHQTIRNEDLSDRRALVEQWNGDDALKREQVVGQWAAQELRAGSILTPRLVEAAPLVRTGQLVTVTAEQGTVQIKTVARATEGGSFGQTIKLKNETTGETFDATLTGPQTAKVSATVTGEHSNVAAVGN